VSHSERGHSLALSQLETNAEVLPLTHIDRCMRRDTGENFAARVREAESAGSESRSIGPTNTRSSNPNHGVLGQSSPIDYEANAEFALAAHQRVFSAGPRSGPFQR
jgi:hypothetical protein